MTQKKKQVNPVLKHYFIPADENELRQFINAKKSDMMEQTVDSIEYALNNNLPAIEIFQFKDSEFVVVLFDKEFLLNLDHIYNHYLSNEMYEYCGRVMDLRKKLGNTVKLNDETTIN
jgi:hypothetical protein